MTCACRCHLGGVHPSCDTGTVQPGGQLSCMPCDGPQQLLDARDHWQAVDRLTQPVQQRLVRDNGHSEHIQLPSLLDQLTEAMDGGETGGAHSVPTSRPPMDVACMSLLIDITNTVRDALRQRRIKRTFNLAEDLRALTSAVNTEGDPGRIDQCVQVARRWAGEIRAVIGGEPDRTWRLHSAACRVCRATQVPVYGPDGVVSHQPALRVHSDDGRIDRIVCDFCGSVLSGPEMVDIVRRARTAIEETA